MSFLSPWAFGFLALAPVIVLLYLLKSRRRPAPVSTLMFWQRVLVETRRRALFQRLRQLLSLLLHLFIFLLILLALAKPELSHLARNGGVSTVLILDSRARMQAVENDGETRFEKARRSLDARARQASARDAMALLSLSARAEVIAPFSDDEKALQQSAAQLQPTDASGEIEDALRLADKLLSSRAGAKKIVLFTDRKIDAANFSKEIAASLECVPVGSPHDNLAITRFAARPLLNSPQTSQVLLEVRNFGSKPARGNIELFFDETLIDVKPFDLAPDARRVEVFDSVPRTAPNSRGWLRAHIDAKNAKDNLALDDDAFAVIPPNEKKHVLLVTRGNWFIEKMLDADELIQWELLTPESFQPEMAANFDAVILDNALPQNFNAADLEKSRGNFLFIKQTPFNANAANNGGGKNVIEQPLVSDIDSSSPLMRFVALQNVVFLRSVKLDFREKIGPWHFDAPLRSFENPLIITGSRPAQNDADNGKEQRIAAFAFDVTETDLPLRVAFPLLMANTLEWLANQAPEPILSVRAGESVALAPGETVLDSPQKKMSFDASKNADANASANSAPIVSGEFSPLKNGWYLAKNGGRISWIAVNTFSEKESDLRFASASAEQPNQQSAAKNRVFDFSSFSFSFGALALIGTWPLWTYLAFAAFVLFALEWWLFHRRRTE